MQDLPRLCWTRRHGFDMKDRDSGHECVCTWISVQHGYENGVLICEIVDTKVQTEKLIPVQIHDSRTLLQDWCSLLLFPFASPNDSPSSEV